MIIVIIILAILISTLLGLLVIWSVWYNCIVDNKPDKNYIDKDYIRTCDYKTNAEYLEACRINEEKYKQDVIANNKKHSKRIKWYKFRVICFGIILWGITVISFVGIISLGINIDNNVHKQFILSYQIQKETIEDSINNENLTGFERVELVRQVNELNSELAIRKQNITNWYNCHVDDNIYNGIEFISLKGE